MPVDNYYIFPSEPPFQPIVETDPIPTSGTVTKIFSDTPYAEGEPKDFYKGFKEMSRNLFYGGESIRSRYKKEFEEIEALEKEQTCQLDEDLLDTANSSLKTKVKIDFLDFLAQELGDQRIHLIPEIINRFSQKTLTAVGQELVQHSLENFKGYFVDETGDEKITLIIPKTNPKAPILLEYRMDYDYSHFHPVNRAEKKPLRNVIHLKVHGVYRIETSEQIRGIINFSFQRK